MRAVIQRVTRASVTVDGRVAGEIGAGLLVLLGVSRTDNPEAASYLAEKIANLRIFSDEAGKMNKSLLDNGGSALVVSQFTLYGDTRGGRRPSYIEAATLPEAKQKTDLCARNLSGLQFAALGTAVHDRRSVPGAHAGRVGQRWPGHDSARFREIK